MTVAGVSTFQWDRSYDADTPYPAMGVAAVAGFVGAGAAGRVGLLLSDTGSRWVLERVPGLSLERYQGALLGRWQADRLQWESDETRVALEQPLMELDAACLWRGMLCLEQLQVKRVTLELPDSTDEPDEPAADVELPDINLPVAVRIGQLEVGELLLNGEGLLSQLQLAASASGNELVVGNLSLVYDTYQAALDGRLQLNEQWPLEFTLDAGGELPELGQQQLSMRLDGALRDEVRLDGVLQGALTGTLQARLQPFAGGPAGEPGAGVTAAGAGRAVAGRHAG
jgi:translocation and assembly module TamB